MIQGKIPPEKIAKVDTDGDGKITHAELQAHFVALSKRMHELEQQCAPPLRSPAAHPDAPTS